MVLLRIRYAMHRHARDSAEDQKRNRKRIQEEDIGRGHKKRKRSQKRTHVEEEDTRRGQVEGRNTH